MRVFVNIATYNEKENIADLIKGILALEVPDLKIIVIDDSSPDGTAEIVRQNFIDRGIEIIVRKGERGYGSAHIRGFKEALNQQADIIITMDADLSHQPKVIPLKTSNHCFLSFLTLISVKPALYKRESR